MGESNPDWGLDRKGSAASQVSCPGATAGRPSPGPGSSHIQVGSVTAVSLVARLSSLVQDCRVLRHEPLNPRLTRMAFWINIESILQTKTLGSDMEACQ